MKKQPCGYGPHLMMDLNECNQLIIDDLEACFNLLNELPEKIGMTKITQPYVFRYSAPLPDDEGITGITIIAESHISLHTYPKKRFAFMDLFSCKPFDIDMAKNYIIKFFESNQPAFYVQKRGIAFPVIAQITS